jgi:hypothetical protein
MGGLGGVHIVNPTREEPRDPGSCSADVLSILYGTPHGAEETSLMPAFFRDDWR